MELQLKRKTNVGTAVQMDLWKYSGTTTTEMAKLL